MTTPSFTREDVARELLLRRRARESFYEFFKQAWPTIAPGYQYVDGWHIGALAEHLEAVWKGQIRNLLINAPPRTLKTLIVDVAFPAWTWLNEPTLKFIYGSYSYAIAEDASIQCRALLRSRWFRARWGDEISLSPERDTKEYFANTQGGERIISSVDGTLTGRGGDILIGNDLNRVGDEHKSSDADLSSASHFWNTVIPTRLNDPKTGRKIVVQQRTHERDISGEIIDRDPDGKEWVKLILPLEFESERRCVTVPLPSTKGKPWRDPRKKEGESLIPGRMGPPEIASLKKALGSQYAISGQLQQRPSPSEGGIIKKAWFQWWKQSEPPKCEYVVLSVDTALSKNDMNAFSAATAWGVFKDDDGMSNVILLMRWRERVEYPELRERMKRLSKNYLNTRDLKLVGPAPEAKPPDLILIEAKANGLSLIQDLRRANIMATPFNPDKLGDKTNRVRLVTPILEGGRVWMPAAGPKFTTLRPYADEFVEAAAMFPNAKSRDLVDTMTQALWRLQVSGWVWAKGDDGPGEAQDFSQREAFY